MTRLKVIVRVRPMSQREKHSGSQNVVTVENDNNIAVTNIKVPQQNAGDSRERVRRFVFDYCFSENASQDQIFETVENVVGTSLRNRNHSCVLAYGQTSSGKTHTMMGSSSPQELGLTPRLCRRIFKYFEDGALSKETDKLQVSVSYLEIYNEKVADLLSNSEKKSPNEEKPLKVREHPKKGPYVEGLSQHIVSTDAELLERLESGTKKRRVGSTNTNPKSSRSHSVFSISCDGVKLHLVDLAGNERAGSKGYGPSRFREGANINKSLVALGNVISTLAEQSKTQSNSRNKFVPYRDSVLTWLLKDTLQGNSNTVMIATVSPSSTFYSETVNTLRFGQRAKLIVYKPVNVEDSKEKVIRELRAEIARLRELLKLSTALPIINNMDEDSASEKISDKSQTDKDTTCNTETLLPIMNVKTSMETSTKLHMMDRTYSVDTDNSIKSLSSLESLQSPKDDSKQTTSSSSTSPRRLSSTPFPPKQTALSLKRQSIHKSAPLLKTIAQKKLFSPPANGKKQEKGIVTDVHGSKKSESKVKSTLSDKPRAQIVAAVTSRLYNKVKKKDMGTSTENLALALKEPPKELSICSNARNRLREFTQKALKAHRSKNIETQTDLFPILRVKEVGTDCQDLDLAEVSTLDKRETKDAQVECTLLNQFFEGTLKNILVLTKSCGIQTGTEQKPNSVSFTKYLTENAKSPIFTEAVNINISHNYISSGSLSDDSLDNERNNVSFPTPDIISNHNSLEQQVANTNSISGENRETKLHFAQNSELNDSIFEKISYIPSSEVCTCRADILTVPTCWNNFKKVQVQTGWAPQTISKQRFESCECLADFKPKMDKCKVKIYQDNNRFNMASHYEPMVYTCVDTSPSESSEDNFVLNVAPDSLEYHHKKVQFARNSGKQKSDKMLKAMKEFLDEAKLLMSNIAGVNKCQQPHLDDFDIHVTVNDMPNLEKRKRRRKLSRESNGTQTERPLSMHSSYSQTSLAEYVVPINKYEALVEDSCKRLEEQIKKKLPRSRHISIASDYDEEIVFDNRPKYNPWDLSNIDMEDSSLESNPVTFSDYGSLPRKTHKRYRTPACSPSAFLKQLTQMRRHIIENSREELLQRVGSSSSSK